MKPFRMKGSGGFVDDDSDLVIRVEWWLALQEWAEGIVTPAASRAGPQRIQR